jgi:hypothetical protein
MYEKLTFYPVSTGCRASTRQGLRTMRNMDDQRYNIRRYENMQLCIIQDWWSSHILPYLLVPSINLSFSLLSSRSCFILLLFIFWIGAVFNYFLRFLILISVFDRKINGGVKTEKKSTIVFVRPCSINVCHE